MLTVDANPSTPGDVEQHRSASMSADGRLDRGTVPAPGGPEAQRLQLLALGADVVALGYATAGRALRIPPARLEWVAPVWLLESLPGFRGKAEGLLGREQADASLAVASATASGLVYGVLGLVVDAAHRIGQLSELRAREAAWQRRAATLEGGPPPAVGQASGPRAAPLPWGPVERAGLSTLAGLGGAAAFAASAPQRAGQFLLLGLPRAARFGREAFAAQLGRVLSARGIIPLDAGALRRLDRVDTVVLDANVLLTGRWALQDLQVLADGRAAELAAQANALLVPGRLGARRREGSWRLRPLEQLDLPLPSGTQAKARRIAGEGRRVLALCAPDRVEALLTVAKEIDPQARDLVREARRAGLRVLIAGKPPAANRLEPDGLVEGGDGLASDVQRLQRAGHVVAVVSASPSHALRVADCGIGLVRNPDAVPWSAHLLAGASLDDAAAILRACSSAREASRRSAVLSIAGSTLGMSVALADPTPRAGHRAFSVVSGAALAAIAAGAWAGLSEVAQPPRPAVDPTPWHALPTEAVLRVLDTSERGLPVGQARWRRRPDARAAPPVGGVLGMLADELANPLTPVLAVGAGLSAAMGSIADAGLVAGVLGFNAAVGAAQRLQTDRAVRRLHHATSIPVRMLRDGKPVSALADDLVAGDVVVLQSGDPVPADCRLLSTDALEVDESSLTGESLPIAKSARPVPADAVADRTSMLYEGTTIAAGEVSAVVVATGEATETGRSAAGASRPAPNGVERRLGDLTAQVVPASLAGGAAAATLGLLRGQPIREVLSTGVSLTVAAVPEGLPLLATLAQLAAARRLSQRGALVREPRTIEALGRVDMLCVDKTGTLTEGSMELRRVTDGSVEETVDALTGPRRSVLAAALRASPLAHLGEVLPHATDRAVVNGGTAAGVTADEGVIETDGDRAPWAPLAELPFESARGFHATLSKVGQGAVLSVKGAPEVVLPLCAFQQGPAAATALDDTARANLETQVEGWARRGRRVLAVAERRAEAADRLDADEVADLELLGFLSLADPVRPAARAAVASMREAGVAVAMITGDHPSTAEAVGAELGVLDGGRVLTGSELNALDEDQLSEVLPEVSVYARVTPADKVRIVAALQRAGRVVVMTGDGVNDAPAIRLADVGVALGGAASTPAARQAADVVVVDDRVETLIDAVVEGRAMWASVRDALAILLGGNLGEVAYTLFTSAFSRGAAITARQLLLVNLLTDMAPATVIALRPPKDTSPETLLREGPEASLGTALSDEVRLRAAATAAGAGGAWMLARMTGRAARARTVGLVALVGTQLGQTLVTGGRSPLVVATGLLSNAALVGIVQTPGLSHFFGCTPLGPLGWAIAGSASSLATTASVVLPRLGGLREGRYGQDPSDGNRKEEPIMAEATPHEEIQEGQRAQEEQRRRQDAQQAQDALGDSRERAGEAVEEAKEAGREAGRQAEQAGREVGEQVQEVGEQAREAGTEARRAAKNALAETAFVAVGIGGYLADGAKALGSSISQGFVNLANRGRIALGSVPQHLQQTAQSAQATAQQMAEGAADVVEEAADTVEGAAEDAQERLRARQPRSGGRAETKGSNRTYEQMTVDELRSTARAAGVERPWKMNKHDLVRALQERSGSPSSA